MQWHFLVLLIRLVHSIEVSPNSKCFRVCVDDIGSSNITDKYSTTQSTDQVVCEDYQLIGPNPTAKGKKWKDCLTCELSSGAVDASSGESDIYWFICKSPVWEDDCGKAEQEDVWLIFALSFFFLQPTLSSLLPGVFLHIRTIKSPPLPEAPARKPAKGPTILAKAY